MSGLASAVQHASHCLHGDHAEHDVVFYTARPSSNGATVFLSCHAGHPRTDDGWKCAPIEELESAMIVCESIHSQNQFQCKVLGRTKSVW
jgi:hypothetical protein